MTGGKEGPSNKDADETLAAAVMTAGLGIEVIRVDLGSVSGKWDLEGAKRDCRRVAAEVVSTRDPAAQELYITTAATGHVARPELNRIWKVSVAADARVKRVAGNLPSLLARFEAADVDSVSPNVRSPWQDEMRQFRIGNCISSAPTTSTPSGYRLMPESTWTFVKGIDVAVERAEDLLSTPLGQRKINRVYSSKADECHIVLLVEESWLDVENEIRTGITLPTGAPDIPSKIDGLWLVALWPGPTRGVFWARGQGWGQVVLWDDWRPPEWRSPM